MALDGVDPLALPAAHRQADLPIHPVHALLVHRPAFEMQSGIDSTIAVAPLLGRDLREPVTQLGTGRPPTLVAIQRPRDPNHSASARYTQLAFCHQHLNRLALCMRAYYFRPRRSLRAALSSSASASNRLSRLFSCSSSVRRRASETVFPPYFAFQLYGTGHRKHLLFDLVRSVSRS